MRVSDGSAAAQAYACDGRCNHQLKFKSFQSFYRCSVTAWQLVVFVV
jgi:hypothetical protein